MNNELRKSIIRNLVLILVAIMFGLLALAGVWAICASVAALEPIGFVISVLCIVILVCIALD